MTKRGLPKTWAAFRKQRYQQLFAQGFDGDLARRVASWEAQGRRNIAKVVGLKAARDAELDYIDKGNRTHFVLVGDFGKLTNGQREALAVAGGWSDEDA